MNLEAKSNEDFKEILNEYDDIDAPFGDKFIEIEDIPVDRISRKI